MDTHKTLPPFPIEEVSKYPLPGFVAPGTFAFSPDDRLLTFLFSPEGSLTRQLYVIDLQNGRRTPFSPQGQGGTTEQNVSRQEALRRERQRQLNTGVTQYSWDSQGRFVLIPFPDGLYLQKGSDAPLEKLYAADAHPVLDPQLSPDGQWVAFVQDAELYILATAGGAARQLTSGARGSGRTHGLAEYAAQEEMNRFSGFWWSPDSRAIAFEMVDESHIPVYRIVHQGKATIGEEAQEDHRYPFAGKQNALVGLGVVTLADGQTTWLDLGECEYLARVQWFPDGRLTAQLQDRAQSRLDLVAFELPGGTRTTLLTEHSATWVNLHDMLKPLGPDCAVQPGGFIWASERSGYRHLYLHDRSGQMISQLTSGEWMVDSIAGVDPAGQMVYFTAGMDSPLECHLYAVPLSGGQARRLTNAPGNHAVWLDHRFQRFVDCHDALDAPPHVDLCSLQDGSLLSAVYKNSDPRPAALGLRPPELVTLRNRDGVMLHAALYRPAASSDKPRPVIVSVYGGPHAQMVANAWRLTAAMRAQHLSGLGYLVFVLDNRGSARRGLAFEGAIKHDMGNLEVQDQVDGVVWLAAQGLADPERVGIYGWSYGGYMAAMCLARAPETFKVAVAGAPVTHWDGYDTHYTERYMGTPDSNPAGYEISSVMHHVANMRGKLLLVHGLIDENVHFRHTARLVNALIQARKAYDLLLFPDERHSPRRLEDRVFMEEQIRDYFLKNL